MTTQASSRELICPFPQPRVLGRQDVSRNTLVSAAADIYPLLCITEKTNAHLAYSTGGKGVQAVCEAILRIHLKNASQCAAVGVVKILLDSTYRRY